MGLLRLPMLALAVAVTCGGFGVLAPTLSPAIAQINPRETNPVQAEAFRRGYNAYIRGEFALAAQIWTRLGDQGHIKSMNNLGTMYAQGKAVIKNYPLALQWYHRAADRGDARALYNIGIAHEHGRGVEQNDASALSWYRRAADRGVVEGMNRAAWILATSTDVRVRDGAEAIRLAEFSLKSKTSSAALSVLAAAHAEAGEYHKAVFAIERAIDYMKREKNGADMVTRQPKALGLLRQEGQTEDLFRLLERREYYINGKPTRVPTTF